MIRTPSPGQIAAAKKRASELLAKGINPSQACRMTIVPAPNPMLHLWGGSELEKRLSKELRCQRCIGHLGPHSPGLLEVIGARLLPSNKGQAPRAALLLICGHESRPMSRNRPVACAILECGPGDLMPKTRRGRTFRARCPVCDPPWPPRIAR